MTYFGRIKEMNVDELAKFIDGCSSYGGFMDKCCAACDFALPQDDGVIDCSANNPGYNCLPTIRKMLMSEATDEIS